MSYATAADFDRFGIRPDALPATITDQDKDAAISAASGRADSYLGARFRLPISAWGDDLRQAVGVLLKRGKGEDVKRVRLESLAEGRCVQMLHVGPYNKEHETIAVMKAFAEKQQLGFSGKHHEIYLSDPRRVPPERLKTILRHPVRPG